MACATLRVVCLRIILREPVQSSGLLDFPWIIITIRLILRGGSMHKKFMILMSICGGYAHALQQSEAGERTPQAEKEREEKAQQALRVPQTIPIHGVQRRGAEMQEEITAGDTEPLTAETFEELIARQRENQDSFVLARVVTINPNGSENIHYYDAYSFNRWRFGKYPLSGRKLKVAKKTNPLNRLKVHDVQYFSYDPAQPEQGFRFLCTENDIRQGHRKAFLLDWLEANQNFDEVVKGVALMHVADRYWLGGGVPRDYKVARSYSEKAERYSANPIGQANAWLRLGYMYRHGLDVERNYEQARIYFEKAAQQTADAFVRASAQFKLGAMYLNGLGVPLDYVLARAYFEQAAQPTAHPFDQAGALAELGEIYYEGHGVARDYAQALIYLQQAVHQTVNEEARAKASLYLGIMYLYGFGVAPDLTQAQTYLEGTARQTIDQSIRTTGQRYLQEVADRIQQVREAASLRKRAAESENQGSKRQRTGNGDCAIS